MGKRIPESTWKGILEAITAGHSVVAAASRFGVSLRTIERRQADDAEYAALHAAARAEGMAKRGGHGTTVGYKRGCRCDACRPANNARHAELRQKRRSYPTSRVPHGLNGYSNYGCRCEVCAAAWREYLAQCKERRRGSPDTPHGTSSGYASYGCRCEGCTAAYVERYSRANVERARRVNDGLRERARRHGAQWTGPELEIASRPDLSSRQVAEMLGRTFFAVQNMRRKLREPLPDHIAGVSRRSEGSAR